MSITVVGTGTYSFITGDTFRLTQPAGTQAGDFGIIVIYATGTIPTPPSGWTQLVHTTSDAQGYVFYRVYTGTDPNPQWAFTAAGGFNSSAQLEVFRGVDNSSPIVNSTTTFHSGGTTSAAQAMTAPVDQTMLASIMIARGVNPVLTEPAGYTLGSKTSSNGYSTGIASAAGPAINTTTGTPAWSSSITLGSSYPVLVMMKAAGTNAPPSVNAGADATVIYGDTLTQTAVGSDLEGAVTYAWTVQSAPSGSSATITNASTATMSFKPDKPGSYTLRCTVTDSGSVTAFDDVIVTSRAQMWVRVAGVAKPAQRRIRKNGSVA